MNYLLNYKCENCDVRFTETISEEDLKKTFEGRCGCNKEDDDCDVMSADFLYILFQVGIDIHKCYPNGTTSYGKCVSIRPIREDE